MSILCYECQVFWQPAAQIIRIWQILGQDGRFAEVNGQNSLIFTLNNF
jgi:hypothetical protein